MDWSVCRLPEKPKDSTGILPVPWLNRSSFPCSLPTIAPTERFLQDLPPYEVVHPTRVSVTGHFLSNFLSHRARRIQRRHVSGESMDQDRVFYQLWHAGHSLHFNLTLNPHLLAPGFLTERRYGGLKGGKIRPPGFARCHFLGEVWDGSAVKGNAAISTCDGLVSCTSVASITWYPAENWQLATEDCNRMSRFT